MSNTRREFLQGSLALMTLPRLPQFLPQNAKTAPLRDELWYAKPAAGWREALPIGNGKTGGMVFGGPQVERLALSDSTAWSGAPATGEVNPGALPHLQEIRNLFFAGKYDEAQSLCNKYLPGHSRNFGTNLPLPELRFTSDGLQDPTVYRRSLILDEAIARVRFRNGDIQFEREFLATHADGVLAVRFTSSRPGQISFRTEFDALTLPATVASAGQDTLVLQGHAYEHKHSTGHDGVALQIRARVLAEGGAVSSTAQAVEVHNANAVTVLIALATSYGNEDPEAQCSAALQRASGKSFQQLRKSHISDYQPLYRRTFLDLGPSTSSVREQPTDARRKALENGADDPELLALFFQYGRYLTIAGSREDSPLPLALQGIWNDGLASSMGWTDDFHLDINTEQNYWPAEVCNLSECQTPLFTLIDILRTGGRTTAKEMYGAPGWVAHTIANPWGFTAPGGIGWGIFATAGVWISLQLWDHYTFNPDVEFLRARAYPALREAAEFFLAYMVTEPKHGWLVTGPSDSPENWYTTPSGSHASESMGNTIDRVLVHALFSMCIEAAQTLNVDDDLRQRLESARAKLPPLQIGRHGQLQEWMEDFEDAIPNHRHTAHLISLYPEHQISPRTTPELAHAAEVTIQRRISAPHWEQSEWGRANLIVYYARLLKGNDAHESLLGLLAKATEDNLLTISSAGIAGADQNIFAIDGNTAGAAGIAEMLLQSQAGEIEFLPALPASWFDGTIQGLRARGGYIVGIEWRAGKLAAATVSSRHGGSIPVRYGDRRTTIHLRAGEEIHLHPESFTQTD
jgi:alpha-L-fucosidase 2